MQGLLSWALGSRSAYRVASTEYRTPMIPFLYLFGIRDPESLGEDQSPEFCDSIGLSRVYFYGLVGQAECVLEGTCRVGVSLPVALG